MDRIDPDELIDQSDPLAAVSACLHVRMVVTRQLASR